MAARYGVWAIVCAIALLLVLLIWRVVDNRSSKHAALAHVDESHNADANQVHQHQNPELEKLIAQWPDDERYDAMQHRFHRPALLSDGLFHKTETTLQRDVRCKTNLTLAANASAEQQLQYLYALPTDQRYPEDVFFRTLTQFWSLDGEYYQLSAVWDIGIPPVYRIQFFASPTPDFSRDVIDVPPPLAIPAVLDAAASAQYVAQLSAQYEKQGAQLGQRILEMEIPSDQPDERVSIKLVDAQPLSWSFPGGLCMLKADGRAMQCQCFSTPAQHEQEKTRTG
jgi:hypothetical protein